MPNEALDREVTADKLEIARRAARDVREAVGRLNTLLARAADSGAVVDLDAHQVQEIAMTPRTVVDVRSISLRI